MSRYRIHCMCISTGMLVEVHHILCSMCVLCIHHVCMMCHTSCVWYGITMCGTMVCVYAYLWYDIHTYILYMVHMYMYLYTLIDTPYTVYMCTMYTSCVYDMSYIMCMVWYHYVWYHGMCICIPMVWYTYLYTLDATYVYVAVHPYRYTIYGVYVYYVYIMCMLCHTSCVCLWYHGMHDIMVCVYIPMYACVHTIHHVVVLVPIWGTMV